MAASVRAVVAALQEPASIDTVLGFSQGASFAAALVEAGRRYKLEPLCRVRCVLLFSGFDAPAIVHSEVDKAVKELAAEVRSAIANKYGCGATNLS